MKRAILVLALIVLSAAPASAATITEKTANLKKLDGFIPLYWDDENGKLMMEISRFGEELLYQTGLPAGLGSNPVGLDRGELSDTRVVRFERVGPKVLLIQLNDRYRAGSQNANERRAVEESFAQSILGGFKVEASDGARVLVDATSFLPARRARRHPAPERQPSRAATHSTNRAARSTSSARKPSRRTPKSKRR